MIYLFNNNEEMIRIIPNSAIKRMYQTQKLTDENYISDRLDVEIQALNDEELSELEYMAIDDIENPQRFHYYFIAKETTEHQITSLTGVQSGIEELRKTPVYDMRPTNLSPKLIADRLLEGTNWQAGYTTDDVGTISTNFYYTDVFSALKKMCMAFGIEMQFFVEITTNRIGARYIEFRKRTGKSVGKRVVYGHNALKIIKEVEKTNTVTALIGRGKGVQVSESDEGNIGYGRKIGFENVEWKTSSGAPVDKPLGQEFVEIPELTLRYGIKNSDGTVRPKIGFVEFQDEESETRLIDRTYNALLELSRPQVLLETSSVYLPDTGIGDTINVVRHDRDLRYQTRVFEITWDRLANKAVDMKLGDRLGESENKRISRISSQVSGNISTELSSTIDELVDRLTTADGKNTNWYTDYDPMENPETMGLVRVNDNWYQPDPEYEGEFILKQWNGEMWVEILRTSGNPELVRRFEEVEKQAEEAKQDAIDKANQALADAKAHADAGVQASKEHFDSLIEEVESGVVGAQATADSAVEQIDTAVANAGFTSLDDTINNVRDIASGVKSELDTAIGNAGFTTLDEVVSNTRYLGESANSNAQTAISEAQTAQSNSLTALGKAGNALDGVSNLDIRIDDVEGELELKADNTFMNEDGTLTTLSNAITFNAHRFSSDMSRIESRVESLAGEINLVILKDAFENSRLEPGTIYPNPESAGPDYQTMRELIAVQGGEKLAMSKETSPSGFNQFRFNFYDDTGAYLIGESSTLNQYIVTVPQNATKMWVSYPTGSNPQIVRGTTFIPYRPNLADQMTSDEMVIFRNEYDEYADRTERRLTAIDTTGGRLETAEALITQTAESLQSTVGKVDGQELRLSTVEQTAEGLQTTVVDKANQSQVTQLAVGLQSTVGKLTDFIYNSTFEDGSSLGWEGITVESSDTNSPTKYYAALRQRDAYFGSFTPVEVGEELSFSITAWNISSNPQPFTFGVAYYDKDKTLVSRYRAVNTSEPIAKKTYTGKWTVSSSAVYVKPWVHIDAYSGFTSWFFTNPKVSRVATNSKITQLEDSVTTTISGIDGRVTTQKQTLDGISSTVADNEGNIATQQLTINGLQTTVADKANQSQVTQLSNVWQASVGKLTDFIYNSTFEDGSLLGWEGITVETGYTHSPSKYYGAIRQRDAYFGDLIPIEGGERLNFSIHAWNLTSNPQPFRFGVRYYDKDKNPISWYTAIQSTKGNALEKHTASWVTSASARYVRPWAQISAYSDFTPWFFSQPQISRVPTNAQMSMLENNINLRVSKGDVLSQINIEADRALIQSNRLALDAESVVFTGNAFIPSAQIQSVHADKINAGTIDSARINATEIVAQGLTANVIQATHINGNTALFDKLFSTTLATDRLASRDAWITNANIKDLSASKITTGTLNAANVKIVNLDVNNLSGDAMNFISGAFTSNAGSLLLSGSGIRVNFDNGYNLRINGSGTNYYTSGGQVIGGLRTAVPSSSVSHTLSLVARKGYTVSMDYQGSLASNQSNRALSVHGTTGNITIHRPIYESSGLVGLSFTRSEMGNVGWGLSLSSTRATGSGIFLADNGEVWIGVSGGFKQFT